MTWLSQHFHLGDVPTWLAAVGATFAAFVTFRQLRALRTQLSLEIGDLRAAQARQIQIQRLILPWREASRTNVNGFALFIQVTNSSHSPINDIDACFTLDDLPSVPATFSMRGPRSPGEVIVATVARGPVPVERLEPGHTLSIVGPTYDERPKAEATRGELQFTDSDNRRWTRSHTGQLSPTHIASTRRRWWRRGDHKPAPDPDGIRRPFR